MADTGQGIQDKEQKGPRRQEEEVYNVSQQAKTTLSVRKGKGPTHRLVRRFRCGRHGLHVDTCQIKHVAQRVESLREDCFCLVRAPDTAEDEHHLIALHII